jgi:hypothetical protein
MGDAGRVYEILNAKKKGPFESYRHKSDINVKVNIERACRRHQMGSVDNSVALLQTLQ